LRFSESAEFRENQSHVTRLIFRSVKDTPGGITFVILHELATFAENNSRLITPPDHVPGIQLACRKANQEGDQ